VLLTGARYANFLDKSFQDTRRILIKNRFVVGIDIDQNSLEICRSNITTFTSSEMCYDLIQMNLRIGQIPEQLHGIFDLVITNPPFGTKKGTEGIDKKVILFINF